MADSSSSQIARQNGAWAVTFRTRVTRRCAPSEYFGSSVFVRSIRNASKESVCQNLPRACACGTCEEGHKAGGGDRQSCSLPGLCNTRVPCRACREEKCVTKTPRCLAASRVFVTCLSVSSKRPWIHSVGGCRGDSPPFPRPQSPRLVSQLARAARNKTLPSQPYR